MKLLCNIMITVFVFACSNAYAESKKIIKWVDKNGVTQYGDRRPSNVKKSSVLNKRGVTIKKIEPKNTTVTEDKASAAQARQDNALLASYNSVDEIEIARERNIKIDELALITLEEKHKKLNLQLQKNNKTLLGFAKKNQPAPADTANTIERNMEDIATLEKKITKKKQVIEKINQRYENDKVRYVQLESRKGNQHDTKRNQKNIAELTIWRNDVKKRLNFYEAQNLKFKRRGEVTPRHIQDGLVSTTRELENANQEIADNEEAIKRSKAQISK